MFVVLACALVCGYWVQVVQPAREAARHTRCTNTLRVGVPVFNPDLSPTVRASCIVEEQRQHRTAAVSGQSLGDPSYETQDY